MKRILIIKNGKCETEIDKIIKNDVETEIICSREMIFDNYSIERMRQYKGIILLGGSMSLCDIDNNCEKKYIKKLIIWTKNMIINNIPILGICLGAQIIAISMNRKVKRMDKSISNFEVTKNIIKKCHLMENIEDKLFPCLHCDYCEIETDKDFDVYIEINNGKRIPYLFKINGYNVYGVQFHPDITANMLKLFCEAFNFDNSEDLADFANKNEEKMLENSSRFFNNWLQKIED